MRVVKSTFKSKRNIRYFIQKIAIQGKIGQKNGFIFGGLSNERSGRKFYS